MPAHRFALNARLSENGTLARLKSWSKLAACGAVLSFAVVGCTEPLRPTSVYPDDVFIDSNGEFRVLRTQACDMTYVNDSRIVVSTPNYKPTKVKYLGLDMRQFANDEGSLKAVARGLEGQGNTLRALARDLTGRRAKGLSHGSHGPFFHTYIDGLRPNQWEVIDVELSGQIIGYYFNANYPSGPESCVAVQTKTVVTQRHERNGRTRTQVHEYEYHVFGGLKIQQRVSDPNDAFNSSVTGMAITAAQAGSHQFKLWDHVNAPNSSLRVRLAKRKNSGGNWVPLNERTHPAYVIGPEGCFDMLFLDGPTEFLEVAPPSYCLGRCTSPPLVNTGY